MQERCRSFHSRWDSPNEVAAEVTRLTGSIHSVQPPYVGCDVGRYECGFGDYPVGVAALEHRESVVTAGHVVAPLQRGYIQPPCVGCYVRTDLRIRRGCAERGHSCPQYFLRSVAALEHRESVAAINHVVAPLQRGYIQPPPRGCVRPKNRPAVQINGRRSRMSFKGRSVRSRPGTACCNSAKADIVPFSACRSSNGTGFVATYASRFRA